MFSFGCAGVLLLEIVETHVRVVRDGLPLDMAEQGDDERKLADEIEDREREDVPKLAVPLDGNDALVLGNKDVGRVDHVRKAAKCINIVATQSYTSLLNTLNNTNAVKVIVQNLVNKLWFRCDDIFTLEDIQKQIGKEEKIKTSTTYSENAKHSDYNFLTKKFVSVDSNLSESINSYSQFDYIYDYNFFTQNLETFSCVGFLSDGSKIMKPQKISMIPYFK